jgi:signal transduction histidine kinase
MGSVRQKLFMQVGILVLLLVGLTMMANSLFLEPYYTSQLKHRLVDYYETINQMDEGQYNNELQQLIDIESTSNVDIMITTSEWELIYTSNSYFLDEKMWEKVEKLRMVNDRKFRPIFEYEDWGKTPPEKPNNEGPPNNDHPPMSVEKIETINEKVGFYYAYTDPLFSNKILVLSGVLNSGDIIELKVPVISIQESIQITNKFTLICGLVLLLIAFVYAYILSETFTKPIREMNDVTKEIKALRFNQECSVKSSDEIGELASNINDMSRALSEAIASMNQKNDQLETLVNNVSHELKTPLALLQGYAEGINLHIISDEEKVKFYSEVIVDEAKKMNRIVESLLTIKKFASEDMTLFYKDFSVTDLIHKTIVKYEPLLAKNNLDIIFESKEDLLVYGDAFYTEQVLMNYLSNAVQYVEEPYEIRIYIQRLPHTCRVNVFNSFQPISPEALEPVWDEFYKLDQSRTRDKGGHGLGLSIVRAIQEAHGQECGVKSEEHGITFWFDIAVK